MKLKAPRPVVAIEPKVIRQNNVVLLDAPRRTLNEAPFPRTVPQRTSGIHHGLSRVHAFQNLVHGFAFKDSVAVTDHSQRHLHALRRNANQPLLARQRKPANDHRHLKDVPMAYALGKHPQWA